MGKKCEWLTTVSIICLLSLQWMPASVTAQQNLIFLPRVTAGVMYYEYEVGTESTASSVQDSVKLDEYLPFLGLGMTVVAGNGLSLDAYYQSTNTAEIDETGTFSVGDSQVSFKRETELERQDFAVSLGYTMTKNLSFFMGYKYGNTAYDWTDQERDQNGGNVGTAIKENEFITKGPFIGAAYNLSLGNGMLAFNIAVANLDGEITTNRRHRQGGSKDIELIDRDRKEQVSSDTSFWKIGINWNAPITERLSYSIFLDGSVSQFNSKKGKFQDSLFSDDRAHELLDLDSFEVKETVYAVNFSLNYRF
jgi:hypothetical protein